MCGLSGIVVTKPSLIPVELCKAIFSLLMEENDDRGGHSWGAWGSGIEPIRALGKYSAAPKPLHTHLKDFKYRTDEHPSFLFGHTRYGTHGERNVENAHPFEIGNLILAHNGIVDVDGYDEKDHAVDSGRIAMAIYDNGWEAGLAKVEGMCSLLVSVGNQPLFYRHDQVLNYAAFEWGTVVSSTLWDLELVVLKKLGLEPIKIDIVPEDALCQPGFGVVYHKAPAKARKVFSGWSGHSRYYDTTDNDDPAWGEDVWDNTLQRYVHPAACSGGSTSTSSNFSGRSDLPKTTATDNVTKLMQTCAPRLIKEEDGSHSIEYEPEEVGTCEYCGNDVSERDLSMCFTDWSGGDVTVLCLDCIMDEIVTSGSIQVVGRYTQEIKAEEDRLRFGDIPDVSATEDQLSPEDKAELEDFIKSNYKDPHDV